MSSGTCISAALWADPARCLSEDGTEISRTVGYSEMFVFRVSNTDGQPETGEIADEPRLDTSDSGRDGVENPACTEFPSVFEHNDVSSSNSFLVRTTDTCSTEQEHFVVVLRVSCDVVTVETTTLTVLGEL